MLWILILYVDIRIVCPAKTYSQLSTNSQCSGKDIHIDDEQNRQSKTLTASSFCMISRCPSTILRSIQLHHLHNEAMTSFLFEKAITFPPFIFLTLTETLKNSCNCWSPYFKLNSNLKGKIEYRVCRTFFESFRWKNTKVEWLNFTGFPKVLQRNSIYFFNWPRDLVKASKVQNLLSKFSNNEGMPLSQKLIVWKEFSTFPKCKAKSFVQSNFSWIFLLYEWNFLCICLCCHQRRKLDKTWNILPIVMKPPLPHNLTTALKIPCFKALSSLRKIFAVFEPIFTLHFPRTFLVHFFQALFLLFMWCVLNSFHFPVLILNKCLKFSLVENARILCFILFYFCSFLVCRQEWEILTLQKSCDLIIADVWDFNFLLNTLNYLFLEVNFPCFII